MSQEFIDTKSVQVTVISERYSKNNGKWCKPTAWPPKPGAEKGTDDFDKHSFEGTKWTSNLVNIISLYEALTSTFESPTYFVMHQPTIKRRMNHQVFENEKALAHIGGSVNMHLAIFDVDAHAAPDGEEESERYSRVDAWFQDEIYKIEQLQADMPGVIAYRSKNGYRLIALLPEPIVLKSREDCHGYASQYTAWTKYLARKYDMKSTGKEAADDLGDFTRFMRVPHDTNKSSLQSAPHLMLGNPEQIGYWRPTLDAKDMPAAKSTSSRKVQDETLEKGCLLLQLVQNRGLRCDDPYGGAGDYDICCPDVDRHSPDAKGEKDYGSKTRLFLGPVGSIKCMSEGCQHRQSNGMLWVKECFTSEELKQAEKDLGREWKPQCDTQEQRDAERAADEEAHLHFCRLSDYWKETGAQATSWEDSNTPEFQAWCVTKGYVSTPPAATQEPEEEDDFEGEEFVRNDKKQAIWSRSNVRIALRMMGVTVTHDLLKGHCLVHGLESQGLGPDLDDLTAVHLDMEMKENKNMRFSKQGNCREYVQQIAYKARFHPVLNYLNSLKWDGIARLDKWLIDCAKAEDCAYTRAVSAMPLIAMVRRLKQPGCKFDELLVLRSAQGGLKSSALKILAVNEDWYSDNLPLGSSAKETIEQTAGKWVIEFADLHGMGRRGHNDLKAYLSRSTDCARAAFGHFAKSVKRQWIAIATVNDEEYLTDPTGNRRYWPLDLGGAFDVELLKKNLNQLWAEAVHREAKGESIRLDPSLWDEAGKRQKAVEVSNPMEEVLAMALRSDTGRISCADLWEIAGVPMSSRAGNPKLRKAMEVLGWTKTDKKYHGATVSCYQKGDSTDWLKPIQHPRTKQWTVETERALDHKERMDEEAEVDFQRAKAQQTRSN